MGGPCCVVKLWNKPVPGHSGSLTSWQSFYEPAQTPLSLGSPLSVGLQGQKRCLGIPLHSPQNKTLFWVWKNKLVLSTNTPQKLLHASLVIPGLEININITWHRNDLNICRAFWFLVLVSVRLSYTGPGREAAQVPGYRWGEWSREQVELPRPWLLHAGSGSRTPFDVLLLISSRFHTSVTFFHVPSLWFWSPKWRFENKGFRSGLSCGHITHVKLMILRLFKSCQFDYGHIWLEACAPDGNAFLE